ncbi:MAG: ribosome recycling factor [Rhodospirillales bacterium]|nr:ribosome recycling factor [Rhodospirillales bacterium]
MVWNDFNALKADAKHRMDGTVAILHKEFSGLRTGRASTSLVEPIMVEAYGNKMPMNQVGTIGVPEPRLLTVQVWDRGLTKSVEKAIRDANLGLNPQSDGQLIRIPIPSLTAERRQELAKIAAKYSEEGRIAIRNVRRHCMDELKKLEKDHKISEDQHRDYTAQVQKLTDEYIKKIDATLAHKEQEITQV